MSRTGAAPLLAGIGIVLFTYGQFGPALLVVTQPADPVSPLMSALSSTMVELSDSLSDLLSACGLILVFIGALRLLLSVWFGPPRPRLRGTDARRATDPLEPKLAAPPQPAPPEPVEPDGIVAGNDPGGLIEPYPHSSKPTG